MGYFRFFYYIAYIFNTICRIFKKFGKKLLWIVGIFIFLCLCLYNKPVHAVYIGNDTYSNSEYNINKSYNSLAMDFLRRFNNAKNNHTSDEITTIIENRLKSSVYDYYLFYGNYNNRLGQLMINGAPLDTSYVFVFMYPKNNGGFNVGTSSYDNYLGNTCDIISFTATSNRPSSEYWLVALDMQGLYYSYTVFNNETILMPYSLLHNSNEYIYDYFVNNYELQEIELLYDMDEKLTSVDNTLKDTYDYFNEEPSEEDFSTDELPSDSGVTSTTDEGLNNIFTQIYNRLTVDPSSLSSMYNIDVTIPFTNKSFVIPYNLTSSVLAQSSFSWLRSFINAFWCYLVGRYIIIDLIDKFEKIQTGNIENLENGNIKEDLL